MLSKYPSRRPRLALAATTMLALTVTWSLSDASTAPVPLPEAGASASRLIGTAYPLLVDLPWERFAVLAENVVHARISSAKPVFDDRPYPCTRYGLDVYFGLKQDVAPEAELVVGGADDGVRRFEVHGAPAFRVGDEVILFTSSMDEDLVLFGLYGGAHRVVADGAGQRVVGKAFAGEGIPIEEFYTRLESALADAAAKEESR